MKTLSLEQMEVINGGATIRPCVIAKGVAGIGTGLLIAGATLSGGIATGIFASICVYAAFCEVEPLPHATSQATNSSFNQFTNYQ
jgi:hypothetical protein